MKNGGIKMIVAYFHKEAWKMGVGRAKITSSLLS